MTVHVLIDLFVAKNFKTLSDGRSLFHSLAVEGCLCCCTDNLLLQNQAPPSGLSQQMNIEGAQLEPQVTAGSSSNEFD